MFKEKNPGMPLPPGWDFPTITPHPPAARMTSFKKEPPTVKVVVEPKGDIVGYVTVAQGVVVVPTDHDEEGDGEGVKAEGEFDGGIMYFT